MVLNRHDVPSGRLRPAQCSSVPARPDLEPTSVSSPGLLPRKWYTNGMRSTIDKAGRLVIPKPLRDSLGLVPGEVEVTPDGAGLHIEPLADDRLEDEDGLLVIPAADATVSDDLVRTLRDADQR